MAKFKKGTSGNPSGRKPGVGNYTTEAVKKMVTELVGHGMDQALDKFNAIEDPEKQLNILAKFVQYVLPKNMDLNIGNEIKKGPVFIGFADDINEAKEQAKNAQSDTL